MGRDSLGLRRGHVQAAQEPELHDQPEGGARLRRLVVRDRARTEAAGARRGDGAPSDQEHVASELASGDEHVGRDLGGSPARPAVAALSCIGVPRCRYAQGVERLAGLAERSAGDGVGLLLLDTSFSASRLCVLGVLDGGLCDEAATAINAKLSVSSEAQHAQGDKQLERVWLHDVGFVPRRCCAASAQGACRVEHVARAYVHRWRASSCHAALGGVDDSVELARKPKRVDVVC